MAAGSFSYSLFPTGKFNEKLFEKVSKNKELTHLKRKTLTGIISPDILRSGTLRVRGGCGGCYSLMNSKIFSQLSYHCCLLDIKKTGYSFSHSHGFT